MNSGKEVGSGAWQRWTLLGTALVLASALAATAWLNNRSLTTAASDLVDGEARSLLESMRSRLFRPGAQPTEEDVESWMDEVKGRGVSYARVNVAGDIFEKGTPNAAELSRPESSERVLIERHRDVVRATTRIPRPRRPSAPGFRPPPGSGPLGGSGSADRLGPPRRSGPRAPGAPTMVIEFRPVAVSELLSRAFRNLIVNLGVAFILLVLALVGFRLMRRREAIESRRREEAHLLELGETSAVLAHELRNPLASLKGHAQLLKESAAPESKTATKADRIISEALRLERLTNGLLDFVRAGVIEKAQASPKTEIAAAVEDAAASDRDHGPIEINVEDAPESWPLDPDRFRQIATNLVRNAIDASGTAGAVVVELKLERDREKDWLILEVTDSGSGVPIEDRETIFRPFHTTKTRGTGLGLAVSRRLARLHGGSLSVDDGPSGGARFVARFPGEQRD